MATAVGNAFAEFMKNSVNLDSSKTDLARKSRNNLLSNIYAFSGDVDRKCCLYICRISFIVILKATMKM